MPAILSLVCSINLTGEQSSACVYTKHHIAICQASYCSFCRDLLVCQLKGLAVSRAQVSKQLQYAMVRLLATIQKSVAI